MRCMKMYPARVGKGGSSHAFAVQIILIFFVFCLWFGLPRPVPAQENAAEEEKLFRNLASTTPNLRKKAIILLAAKGDEILARLTEFMKSGKEGSQQGVAVLARMNSDRSWELIAEIIKTYKDEKQTELRCRAVHAVGDFWKLNLLPVIQSLAPVNGKVKEACEDTLQAFIAYPDDPDALELVQKARKEKSKENLKKLWKIKIFDQKTGKPARKKIKNGLWKIYFHQVELNPRLILKIWTPIGAFEGIHGRFVQEHHYELHYQLNPATKRGKSKLAFQDADRQRGFYYGAVTEFRKGTPRHWIWIERSGKSTKERHVRLWLDPVMLGAAFPLTLRDYASDNVMEGGTGVPHGTLSEKLKKIQWKKLEIIVVGGDWDHVETVLVKLKIPYRFLSFGSFSILLSGKPARVSNEKKAFIPKLDPDKHVLILNCSDIRLKPNFAKQLRDFVGNGGYLLTTDWAINVLDQVFPDYVIRDRKESIDGTYKVCVNLAEKDHILLQDVKNIDKEFNWWFEPDSWAFVPKHPDCKLLVKCPFLKDLPVAVTWRYRNPPAPRDKKITTGRDVTTEPEDKVKPMGRVLHYVSHLEQQESEEKGTYNLQMCLVNFLKLKELETCGFLK
ncbi:hypothetical protein ACFL54_01685 [Planctomycetota bacterium]